MQKFDIVLVDLNPKKGHAQAGVRPAVVVQSNVFNKRSNTILVVPLTTTQKDPFPSEFYIYPSLQNGLTEKSRFLGSQIMLLDQSFCQKKLGELEEKYYADVHQALSIALDFENLFL